MVEEIEEELQEYFKNANDIIMKDIIFYYNWSDKITFSANIEQIKYNINKIIKEEK